MLVTLGSARLDAIRVVAANSGTANAATGNRGLDEAARMQGPPLAAGRTEPERVAVCSTGVIGVQFDGRKVVPLHAASSKLAGDDADFCAAIMTTDKFEKRVTLELQLSGGPVRLSAQAKGAGMIQPAFATMLCFVQTDALRPQRPSCCSAKGQALVLPHLRRAAVSTNDTVILQAGGALRGVQSPESADELAFGRARRAPAPARAADRQGRRGGEADRPRRRPGDQQAVERVARAVANSPLVKTALYGGDPELGRIAQSIGMALFHALPLVYDIAIEDAGRRGRAGPRARQRRAARRVTADVRSSTGSGCPATARDRVFFSDLGHEYITVNAEYTTCCGRRVTLGTLLEALPC